MEYRRERSEGGYAAKAVEAGGIGAHDRPVRRAEVCEIYSAPPGAPLRRRDAALCAYVRVFKAPSETAELQTAWTGWDAPRSSRSKLIVDEMLDARGLDCARAPKNP